MFFWNSLCFFYDATGVGNLISGSSAFSKSSLNIYLEVLVSHTVEAWLGEFWALLCWHVRWVQLCGSLNILDIAFFWNWDENGPFPVLCPLLSFQICWHIECNTLTASFVRIWNSLPEISSPPLALFIVLLPKAHWTSHSRMSDSWLKITPSWLSGSWISFLYSPSVYSHHFFLISSASVRSIPFPSFFVPIFHEMFPWYL